MSVKPLYLPVSVGAAAGDTLKNLRDVKIELHATICQL